MRFTNLFSKTYKETPKDIETVSHALLLRAGYVRQLGSGIFSYLNFGLRSMKKIEAILREEMNAINGDEICMPIVHPAEIWQKTNRWSDIDASMVRFKDRNNREMVLAMTHEEVVGHLASTEVDTYKNLPKLVYQIYTKFRDEQRSRGGLIRVREFTMKDSYSLDVDYEGLEKQYQNHYLAYFRIFKKAGLPVVAIKSDTGMMGGRIAHEYMYLTPIGEDTVFLCNSCDYKANKEVATISIDEEENDELLELTKVFTPERKSINEVSEFFNSNKNRVAKSVFYNALIKGKSKIILAVLNGENEVNLIKLQKATNSEIIGLATEEQIHLIGGVVGYGSPFRLKNENLIIVADELITKKINYIIGANELNHHYINARYLRDFAADIIADIKNAFDGALCPVCGVINRGTLVSQRGIEVANIFQLGTKYTEALGAFFINETGEKKPIIMGSYGIGVGRLLACLCELHNDEKGLCLPISVSPYSVIIVSLMDSPEIINISDELYLNLINENIDVLYDDRPSVHASPGIKFGDADLIGIPIRITISKRSLSKGGVEVKLRQKNESIIVEMNRVLEVVKNIKNNLMNGILNKN